MRVMSGGPRVFGIADWQMSRTAPWRKAHRASRWSELVAESFNEIDQPCAMRPGPVDPSALRASAEIVVIPPGQRLKVVDHLVLGNGDQPAVAPHAPGERRQPVPQIQSPYHLDRLLLGVVGVDEEATRDSATLQQGTVSGQQDPLLAQADISQGLVIGVTGPPHVEPEHAKQPRQ